MSDRFIGERVRVTDVDGLIDSDTGNIDAALMPTLSGASYVSANQADRLAGTHTGGTVVGGFVVGDVVYQLDTGAYWLVASLPSSVAGNWAPWSVFASSQDTGGGVGNAGKLLALDANGKADGRDLATDGTKLDGIAAGAAALTSSTPAALGAAAVGVATTAARGDHVHAMPSAADVGAQPADATLAALAGLNPTAGLVEQTGADAFTKRLIGVANATDIPTRADADGRYDAAGAAAAVQTNLEGHINDGTAAHASSAISMTRVGASTYSTEQDSQDVYHSAGWVSGGVITDAGGGNVNVAAGSGLIRVSSSATASLPFFDWAASNGLAIPSDTTRWIGVEYNAGAPRVTVRTSENFDNLVDFQLGLVCNEAGTLHIHQAEHRVGDHAGQMIKQLRETMGFSRDEMSGGLILSESADTNRYVALSAGAVWHGLSRFAISAINTSSAGRFSTYQHVAAAFTVTPSVQTWPNTQYDNGTNLVTMSANKYANLWFYVTDSGALLMLYGTSEYNTSAQAETEAPPSSTPDRITYTCILVGRIIFKKSETTATAVESAFSTVFAANQATTHNNLGGIQGGTTSEYYHLTSAQYSPINTGTPSADNLLTGAGWEKVSEQTESTTAASTDWLLMETAAGNLRKVQVGNISGSVGSAPTVTGTGAIPYTVRTADIQLTDTTGAALDCTTDALVATLPVSPTASDIAGVMRYAGTTCRSYVKPAALGDEILGSPQLITLGTAGEMVTFQWIDSTMGWAMSRAGAASLTCPVPAGTLFIMLPNATWTQSGGTVSSVKDHSGLGNNATESTNKPAYSATGINSGPALDFNGTTSVLTTASALITSSTAFWWVCTFIPDTVDATIRTMMCQDSRTTGPARCWVCNQFNTEVAFAVIDNSTAGNIKISAAALTPGTKYTIVGTYDGGSLDTGIQMYVNNVQASTRSTTGTFVAMDDFSRPLQIGAGFGAAVDRVLDGKMNFAMVGTGTPTAAQISAWYTFGNSL